MADDSKVKTHHKGVVIEGRAREIIFNITKFFEADKHRANELLRDLNLASIQRTPEKIPISYQLFGEVIDFLTSSVRVTNRVVQSTGVNKNTVTRIKREGINAKAQGRRTIKTPERKTRGKSFVLNNCDLYALSKLITTLYLENKDVPSLNKILSKARSDLNFQGSMTTLRRILTGQLGYKFTRGLNKSKCITIIRPNISGGNSSDDEFETEYLEIDNDMQIDNSNALKNGEELT